MCLLCEELWMPFAFAPEPSAQKFVADAPDEKMVDADAQLKADAPDAPQDPSGTPPDFVG